MANPITLTGTVAAFDWANPHSYIRLDVKDAAGAVVRWDIETHAISLLSRKGWRRVACRRAPCGRINRRIKRDPQGQIIDYNCDLVVDYRQPGR